MSAEEKFCQVVSYVFNPLLMTTIMCAVLHYIFDAFVMYTANYHLILLALVFVFTFVLPMLLMVTLRFIGAIDTMMIKKRENRFIPYLLVAAVYLLAGIMLYKQNVKDHVLVNFMFYGGCLLLLVALINIKFKISAHAISVASVLGVVLVECFQDNNIYHIATFLAFLFLSGLIIYSRLKLKAHDPFEVTTGFSFGFIYGIIGAVIIL